MDSIFLSMHVPKRFSIQIEQKKQIGLFHPVLTVTPKYIPIWYRAARSIDTYNLHDNNRNHLESQ